MSARIEPARDTAAEVLDPLHFPLHGSRLIEASAGTGKTFTIAMLYVRLVLGHGVGRDDARALMPPDILVVTFTDAATKELRERIRARLVEAAGYFRAAADDVPSLAPGEDLLHDLRGTYAEEAWPLCARRLVDAAEWMDEAAVSTIHGWCNRMLSEHAFDSDSLFSQTLETDQSDLRAEVVRDYWRTFLAPLDALSAAEVREWFESPAQLQFAIRGLVGLADRLDEAPEPADALNAARARQRAHFQELKQDWPVWIDEVKTLLDEARAKKRFDARKLNVRNCETWIDKLRVWANDPDLECPDLDDKSAAWARLTPAGLKEIWTDGEPPDHPAFVAMETLREKLAARPHAYHDLLRHAARWVARRFDEEEARRSQMGFDDLLTRLRAALKKPNGARLAQIIRDQYPVALIDEFQDTDPIQYDIFDAVYRIEDNDPSTAIVLIGDPKQAIYAFRGADIYTYLAARRACEGRLYTLKKNFRSTRAMVATVNRCFDAAEQRPEGSGAFLFRAADGRDNSLPFVPADAHGRRDALRAAGDALPALTVWWLPPAQDGKPLSKEAYFSAMAASCATEMVRLLNLGQTGNAGFAGERGVAPLLPSDIAVLVNNRDEAHAIRRALAERGVRSVYLSDRDSVFATPQADEIKYWLAACAEPDDGRLVRTALATPTLGLDWRALEALGHDEIAWEARVLQFRAYRDCWRRQGVLPMLRRLLNDFHVPQRLLGHAAGAAVDGERALTNLLHLAELLQQASTQLDGEHALIRHLDEQRGDAGAAGGDAAQLRLESDAGLVQVVTIHKSKGLEYPLVFLPFACAYRAARPDDMPLKWHDDEGTLHVTLGGDPDALRVADRERLGEDLRKLYVALTRARYATWVGFAPVAGVEHSAFGYLVGGGAALAGDDAVTQLDALRGGCDDMLIAPAPPPAADAFATRGPAPTRGAARTLSRPVREHWWIASYSSLGKDGGTIGTIGTMGAVGGGASDANADSARDAPDTRSEDVFLELLEAQTVQDDETDDDYGAPVVPSAETVHGFERGADAGSFLHELMEWAANEGFATIANEPQRLRDTVARRCNLRGWARWIDTLTEWLLHLVREPLRLPPLDGEPVRPIALGALGSYMAEMEFWVAAHRVDTRELDALVTDYTLDGAARPALDPNLLNGMLKGFIDLVFEHDGRYYVVDYKSNWLGPDDAAYTPAKMRAQILHSRYELQYVLYLFALHRLLKVRVPDYDYDAHVGGAVYVFLRGARSPGQGLHVERPPRELIEQLDELFARDEAGHPAIEDAV
ncbi:DNA helicase/exodeoxyribonuclease V beta subunit [Paraburkholderia caballeronis]|uniref:exodeoxyribonuclease V subunit beta n=1 Tax=Paraburkholderia caballeronis TaxID=416943 RepID=UPI0010671841|nr:exodeoxyribonuclease V subunit beta [Paraburkholderia caballeronis]TDV39066.1 DNA helicase/exodeoxyribonuclease V beta subunit [Paraburkholderia caballeronis]